MKQISSYIQMILYHQIYYQMKIFYILSISIQVLYKFNQEEKNMQLRKNKKTIMRSNSTNFYSFNKRPTSFQTIYKRRTQTINQSQLLDNVSPKISKENFYKSQIISPQIRQLQQTLISPSIDIKDYVKKMVNKEQKPVSKTKLSYNRVNTKEDEDDKLSRRSIKSSISNQFFKKQSSSPVMMQTKTIQQLQKRIDQLVNQTVCRLKRQKSSIGLTKNSETNNRTQFFKQIEEIHQIINYFKFLSEEQQKQKIEDLDKKLQIIEKMMASENIQSGVIKNQYFNWKNQRSNTSSFVNKKLISSQNKFNVDGLGSRTKKNGFMENSIKKQAVSNYHSTSSIYYTKPSKKYYVAPQQKKNTFSVNRQPLLRSNYSTQYINYGNIPVYNYKQSTLKLQPQVSLAIKASNYQQQYKQKLGLTKNIDFKELDCFKDKFKNTNISFMNSSKKDSIKKVKVNQKFNKGNKHDEVKQNINDFTTIRASQEAILNNLTLSKNIPSLKSQNHKEFIWYNKFNPKDLFKNQSCIIKSQMKDKRLDKFKQTFRYLAMKK